MSVHGGLVILVDDGPTRTVRVQLAQQGQLVVQAGGARPQRPDLNRFLGGESPAWYSPPLLARIRSGLPSPAAVAENAPSYPTSNHRDAPAPVGPVLFAYDGSELAAHAIAQAATQLAPRRDALVVCVWQPVDVGFTPTDGKQFDADQATDVRRAAERTADHGASLAYDAGFRARSIAVEAAPTWQGIVQTAVKHDASLIVLGPHRRSGLLGHLQGSVAAAVVAHCCAPVLIVPQQAEIPRAAQAFPTTEAAAR